MASFWKWLLGWELGEVVAHGDWRLRFVAEYSNYVKLALIAILAALVYLTVRSYRREGEAPRRAKAVLAAIRVAVLLLVMGIVLQPAIVLRYVRSLTSNVVVLVDDSQSMGFKDRYADPDVADLKAKIARELGVDPSRLPEVTRTQIAQKVLVGPLSRLAADHPLVFARFSTSQPAGSGASYTREMGVVDLVGSEGTKGPPPEAAGRIEKVLSGLTHSGYTTNLAAGIRGALDLTQGQRVAAIILPTDGQMTTQGASSAIAGVLEYARERGVQIVPILVGDPTPPRNIAVTALQAPREARRGAEIEFTASLAQRNLGGETVTVKLQRRKAPEEIWSETGVTSETVQIQKPSADPNLSARNLQSVVLRCKPDELGDFEYRAIVEARPDEENTGDNWAAAPVRVVEEKIRVLLISGDAGKEFQYLRNYFLRNQDDYLLSVWQQNADANVNQSASTGMKLEGLPRTLDELIGVPGNKDKPGYSVVMLYDPQHTEGGFDKHFVEDLLKPFVHDHHGGLCYIVGNKHTGQTLVDNAAFAPLRDMMAVTLVLDPMSGMARLSEAKPEPWQVRMTSYGMDHPITRLGPTAEDSQELWTLLPGIYWSYPVMKPKPGARVLATSSDPMRRMGSRNEALPLIAVEPYGRGTVLYIGFDETWRWMPVKDGLYHRNFWGNVVRYLASLQARRATLTTGGTRFTLGEPITVELEAYDEAYRPLKKDAVEVDLMDANGGLSLKHLSLKPIEDKSGQFRSTFDADRTGTFQLVAALDSLDPNEPPVSKQIEIELPQAEFVRTEADRDTLKGLAWPQDRLLDAAGVDRLLDIPAGRWSSTTEVPKYLWDTNLALGLIVVLLAVEWVLRKKHNMA